MWRDIASTRPLIQTRILQTDSVSLAPPPVGELAHVGFRDHVPVRAAQGTALRAVERGAEEERLVGVRGTEANVLNKTQLEAQRVAEDLGFVEALSSLYVEMDEDERGAKAKIELRYDNGQTSELTI